MSCAFDTISSFPFADAFYRLRTVFEYAVIEKVEPGIHPHAEEIAWFKFDTEKRGFCEIPKPVETNGEYNYALG